MPTPDIQLTRDPHLTQIRPVVARTPQRLRGVPPARCSLGSPAAVPHLRACRLLRFVAATTCAEARVCRGPPNRRLVRAGRRLALVFLPRDLRLTGYFASVRLPQQASRGDAWMLVARVDRCDFCWPRS
jgi:hypothetical protein